MILAIEAALAGLVEPLSPQDGDCMRWQSDITARLQAASIPACPLTVWGWIDHEGKTIDFVHQATGVGGFVVDFTARQFDTDLPRRWIVWNLRYWLELARVTGVQAVTLTTLAS